LTQYPLLTLDPKRTTGWREHHDHAEVLGYGVKPMVDVGVEIIEEGLRP